METSNDFQPCGYIQNCITDFWWNLQIQMCNKGAFKTNPEVVLNAPFLALALPKESSVLAWDVILQG
jgi:hypothetical protein